MAARPDRGQPVTVLTTLLCAVLGGLLASSFWTIPPWPRIGVVLLGALVATAVAYLLLTAAQPKPARVAEHPPPLTLPPATPVPDHAWWTAPQSAPPARPEPAASPRRPAPPLSSYAEQPPQVAQCPDCGGFRLDVNERAPGFALRCRNPACGTAWNWQPNTPWPAVVVRRNLTGTQPQ